MKSPSRQRLALRRVWAAVLALAGLVNAPADVVLPAIFSDHAVLQRSPSSPVWGRAEPGEKVVVSLGEIRQECVATADGRWRVDLDLSKVGEGPWDLVVAGRNTLTVSDVLVGEVWMCSGQSNMYWPLRQTTNASAEIAASTNFRLRQFRVRTAASLDPVEDCQGVWTVAGPATAGDFSGVAYYFGKSLQMTLGVPIGVINSSWGGTPIEAWTSASALDRDAGLKAAKDRIHLQVREFPEKQTAFAEALGSWIEISGRRDPGVEDAAMVRGSDADWQQVEFPGTLPGDLAKPGILWLRREIAVPAQLAGKDLELRFEPLSGFDAVFWNSEKVGERGISDYPGDGAPRVYKVPGRLVQANSAVVAVRIYSPTKPPKVTGRPDRVKAGPLVIGGNWQGRAEQVFSSPAGAPVPEPLQAPPALHTVPGALFNAMVRPIIPYGIRGILWYQGEANVGRAKEYRRAFPLLIGDWRTTWDRENTPFYFCQLPNFSARVADPVEHSWCALREAQAEALSLPNTGMAVLIDVGEAGDIHPRNKKDPGERLARIALARDYGKPVSYEGPSVKDVRIGAGTIRLSFRGTGGGLAISSPPGGEADSPLRGFTICGTDGKWKRASALIEGEDVVVSAAEVPVPVAVRYAWEGNPDCNLANKEGLPAAPFRTDDFAIPSSH